MSRSDCDCGAVATGPWAGIHSANCAALAQTPTIAEIARIIGRTPTDLDDKGCDGTPDADGDTCDGGTCLCIELYTPAARKILALFAHRVGEALVEQP